MPETLRKFLTQLETLGATWRKDASGHYRVYKDGQFIGAFASGHGKNTKRDEINDVYIRKILNNLKR